MYGFPFGAAVKRYEELDHTADVAIRAYGRTPSELFANAAAGMFSLIEAMDTVQSKGEATVEVTGDDIPNALFRFLSELLFLHETQHIVFREFEVSLEGLRVRATARGEAIDRTRHELLLNVKAVTYHTMVVDLEKGEATIVFDI